MYPRRVGRFRFFDVVERPTERRYDEGNRTYILTLPTGSYEAEEDGDEIHIIDTTTHEMVCTLPAGTYSIDNDEHGAHLYRVPDDENVRIPLVGDEFNESEHPRNEQGEFSPAASNAAIKHHNAMAGRHAAEHSRTGNKAHAAAGEKHDFAVEGHSTALMHHEQGNAERAQSAFTRAQKASAEANAASRKLNLTPVTDGNASMPARLSALNARNRIHYSDATVRVPALKLVGPPALAALNERNRRFWSR
jgi:hypothetical protein